MKYQGIVKLIRVHPLGTLNARTKCRGNPNISIQIEDFDRLIDQNANKLMSPAPEQRALLKPSSYGTRLWYKNCNMEVFRKNIELTVITTKLQTPGVKYCL